MPPAQFLAPFSNETDAICIAEMTIENRLDRVTIYGSLALTKDQQGLDLARQMRDFLAQVVMALESEKHLPVKLTNLPAETVKNPFDQQ